MLHVAIVEDKKEDAAILISYLQKYSSENDMEIEYTYFENGFLFLQQYHGEYDVVFMDIDMPGISGMDTARRLRERDSAVLLIFVTALARFALNGYEVSAFDFIVKPIKYKFFTIKMQRVRKTLSFEKRKKILVKTGEKTVSVYEDEILYVDIYNHVLSVHTKDSVISSRGTIKKMMQTLDSANFALCNKSCVVNFRFVEMIDGDDVVLTGGERQPISRLRKTEFMQQIADYYGSRKINMGRF